MRREYHLCPCTKVVGAVPLDPRCLYPRSHWNVVRASRLGLLAVLALTPAAVPAAAYDPVTDAAGRTGPVILVANETARFAAGDIATAGRFDPKRAVVELRETAGAEVVARLTPQVAPGMAPHGGRVVVLNPGERRLIRLGAEFNPEYLTDDDVLVEVVQGKGRVEFRLIDLRDPGFMDDAPLEEGASQDSAEALAVAERTPRRHLDPQRLTSVDLIDQAVAAGTLDGETAVVYRVYSVFTDARLPAQFRGDDTNLEGTVELDAVRRALPTLSPANQALVQPFLVPPAYRGSWASPAPAPAPRALDTPPPCQFFADTWDHVDTSNGVARVWWRQDATDAGRARAVADRIDNVIWPKITGVMGGHLPMSDASEDCNGGSGRLDIYIVDQPRSFAMRYRGCPAATPAYILLGRASFPGTVAHEIFHAFQFAFPLAGCWGDKERYAWWGEASAEWVQDLAFPSENQEHGVAGRFLAEPEKPLDTYDETTQRHYGAYLLPFFVQRKTGNTALVRQAWENCATQPALEAIDQALPGGFAAVWSEFALYDWNRTPVKFYETWDTLPHRARPAGGVQLNVSLAGAQDAAVPLRVELPRLSATYKYFSFSDTTARSVAFWNGATFKLDRRDQGHFRGVEFVTDPLSPEERKGAKVQALVKIAGQDWLIEDWTELPYRTFCRDMAAERLEELVIIISNSEFQDRARKLQPPGLGPTLWVSNMGCWQWKGKITLKGTGVAPCPGVCNFTFTQEAQVTFTRRPTSQFPPAVDYELTAGDEAVTVTGDCTGYGTFPAFGDAAILQTFNFIPPEGEAHRTYAGAGATTAEHPMRQVGITCPGYSGAVPEMPWWVFPPRPIAGIDVPLARWVRVSADGTKLVDSFRPGTDSGIWEWNLNAERQP